MLEDLKKLGRIFLLSTNYLITWLGEHKKPDSISLKQLLQPVVLINSSMIQKCSVLNMNAPKRQNKNHIKIPTRVGRHPSSACRFGIENPPCALVSDGVSFLLKNLELASQGEV